MVLVTLPVILKTIISVTGLLMNPPFSSLKLDAKSSEMWFWSPSLPVVLVTIISRGCDESPVSSSFPLSSFSHLLLVQTHHQIVRSVITISFPMHQHRRCHNRQKLYQYSVSFQTTVGKLNTRRICLV